MVRVLTVAGEVLADLPTEDVDSVRSLKLLLAKLQGISRFRQRILQSGSILADDALLNLSVDVQLVVLPVSSMSPEQAVKLTQSAELGYDVEVENLLQTPVDPNDSHRDGYRAAFFFAVGNTLVAKDLEQATRIGLQGRTRHRVVTLAGGLIDASGTMSGGGGKVASGGMRASVCKYSQEEVKKFVQAYEEANTQLMQLRQEREALDEALNSTDREIPELELRERTCSMDVNALKKQAEAYESRLKTLKVPQLTGEEKAKIKQLEKLIESRSEELSTIMEQHQVVEEEVRDLHNQIMNIGGEELKQAKSKLEEATKKCEDMRHKCKKSLLDADNMAAALWTLSLQLYLLRLRAQEDAGQETYDRLPEALKGKVAWVERFFMGMSKADIKKECAKVERLAEKLEKLDVQEIFGKKGAK
ncbi:SMC4 [Symbiodinium natans]|uniref:SMC4 protein n=1 Tax=Symbiodinium natans TaxID=878477 RepID=A0A812SQ73_9DINO|nr:SMC4 [Symbiodinium natans]